MILLWLLWRITSFKLNIPSGFFTVFSSICCIWQLLRCFTAVVLVCVASLMPLPAISSCSHLPLLSMWRKARVCCLPFLFHFSIQQSFRTIIQFFLPFFLYSSSRPSCLSVTGAPSQMKASHITMETQNHVALVRDSLYFIYFFVFVFIFLKHGIYFVRIFRWTWLIIFPAPHRSLASSRYFRM